MNAVVLVTIYIAVLMVMDQAVTWVAVMAVFHSANVLLGGSQLILPRVVCHMKKHVVCLSFPSSAVITLGSMNAVTHVTIIFAVTGISLVKNKQLLAELVVKPDVSATPDSLGGPLEVVSHLTKCALQPVA